MIKKIGRRSIAVIIALGLLIVPFAATPVSADVLAVEIYQPLQTAPAVATPGGSVDVTVAVSVNTSDYYMVSILVSDGVTDIGYSTDLLQLNNGTNVITLLVPLAPGAPYGLYDVTVTADYPGSFIPTVSPDDTEIESVAIGPLAGAGIGAILVGKPILMTEAVLDKLIPPSGINDYLLDGNAYDLLSGEGKTLVDGVALLSSNGLGIAGGVVSAIRGSVITYVPMVVNGALSLAADLLGLFSTRVPFAP